MNNKTEKMMNILGKQKVIPIVVLSDPQDAIPMAEALVSGGLHTIEITLRTKKALECIHIITENVKEAKIGAGTVLSIKQFEEAEQAGAQFIISPGLTKELLETNQKKEIPWIPGAITPSEMMLALSYNLNFLKFFPAETAGGAKFLQSIAAPFPEIKFCPTGGISLHNKDDYLTLSNVSCIGSSWISPPELITKKDWKTIQKRAKEASSL